MQESAASSREAEANSLRSAAGDAQLGAELEADDARSHGEHGRQQRTPPGQSGVLVLPVAQAPHHEDGQHGEQ